MKGRIAAIVMCALLALYLVLTGTRAVQFVLTGEPIAVVLGIALIVLPIIGVAEEGFPKYRAEVGAQPRSWRAWFRLGLAYDASGDRRRARWALREAIRLSRSGG